MFQWLQGPKAIPLRMGPTYTSLQPPRVGDVRGMEGTAPYYPGQSGSAGGSPGPLLPVHEGSLVSRVLALFWDRHLLCLRSHTVSWGQQCKWSEQQMA